MANTINIKNRKARFDYEIIETFEAGLQLLGTEIKSIREGKVSLVDSYCFLEKGELWIVGMRIAEYKNGGYTNHDPYRNRKLLLSHRELNRIDTKSKSKGLTIIPLRLFISEKGYAKLAIALARGQRQYDKRESLKQKDVSRELDRAMKNG